MNRLTYFIFLPAMCLFSTGSKAQAPREVGSYQSLDVASQETTGFCVGAIEDKGRTAAGPMGHTDYLGITVKVYYHLLKEAFPTHDCRYSVLDINIPEKTEVEPTIGKAYLMIGLIEGTRFNIRKLAEPTLENIETVFRVLRQRGLAVNPVKYNSSTIATIPQQSASGAAPASRKPSQSSKSVTQLTPIDTTEPMDAARIPLTMVVMLVAAACGFLCILLKRRK